MLVRRQQSFSKAHVLACALGTVIASLATVAPVGAVVVSDNFNADFNYALGAVGGIWNGSENMLNLNGGLFNANLSNPGVLTVEDNGTFDADGNAANGITGMGWEGGRSTAPILTANVPAGQDFTATVKVNSQTAGAWSSSGLIARAGNSPTPPGIGANHTDENFVSMTTFRTAAAMPDEANTLMKRVQSAVQNNDLNVGVNTAGTEPNPVILKLERIGGVGYRGSISTDNGATFKLQSHTIPAPGNALRDATVPLQVGLHYQNFGTLAGMAQFDDFTLDTHAPLPPPAVGAPVISTSQTVFNVAPGAVIEQLITDSTNQIVEWARTPNAPGADGVFPNGLFLGAPQGLPAPPPDFLPAPASNQTYLFWNTTGRPMGETQTFTVTATNDWGQVSNALTITVNIVPEPASVALIGLAMVAFAALARRKR
jgi:hypothetical protein